MDVDVSQEVCLTEQVLIPGGAYCHSDVDGSG